MWGEVGACDDDDHVYLFRRLGVGKVMMMTMFNCLELGCGEGDGGL